MKCGLHALQGNHITCCPLQLLIDVASSAPSLAHLLPILRRQVDDQSVVFARAVFSTRFANAVRAAGHTGAATFLTVFGDAYSALIDRHHTMAERDRRLSVLENYLRQQAGSSLFSHPGIGERVGGIPSVLFEAWMTLICARRCKHRTTLLLFTLAFVQALAPLSERAIPCCQVA